MNGQWPKEGEYGVEEDGEETEEVGPAHRRYLLWLPGGGVTDPAALTFNPGPHLLSPREREWGATFSSQPPSEVTKKRSWQLAMMERGLPCHYFHKFEFSFAVFKSGLGMYWELRPINNFGLSIFDVQGKYNEQNSREEKTILDHNFCRDLVSI